MPLLVALGLALLTAGSYAELVTKYPQAGGAAVFADHVFRSPLVSFLVGFSMLAAGVMSAAGLPLAFLGDYVATFVDAPDRLVAVLLLAGPPHAVRGAHDAGARRPRGRHPRALLARRVRDVGQPRRGGARRAPHLSGMGLVFTGDVAGLAETGALLLLLVLASTNVAVLVLRHGPVDAPHFRGATVVPVLGVASCVLLLTRQDAVTWLCAGGVSSSPSARGCTS